MSHASSTTPTSAALSSPFPPVRLSLGSSSMSSTRTPSVLPILCHVRSPFTSPSLCLSHASALRFGHSPLGQFSASTAHHSFHPSCAFPSCHSSLSPILHHTHPRHCLISFLIVHPVPPPTLCQACPLPTFTSRLPSASTTRPPFASLVLHLPHQSALSFTHPALRLPAFFIIHPLPLQPTLCRAYPLPPPCFLACPLPFPPVHPLFSLLLSSTIYHCLAHHEPHLLG